MNETEAQTRVRRIDEHLRKAGWNVKDPSQVVQEMDIDLQAAGISVATFRSDNPYSGHQFADYALKLRGKVIAVVEAKKASRDAQLGQEQALQYAENIQRLQGGPGDPGRFSVHRPTGQ